MASTRRNAITHTDSIIVAGVAGVAGVLGALAGCSPTGELVPDVVLCFSLAAVVTWLAASAPWWALLTAASLAVAGSIGGPVVLLVAAVVAVAVTGWIGYTATSQPVLRAAAMGVVVQVLFRLEFDPFFLASALVAAVAVLLVAITGVRRRQRYVRRRVLWSSVGVSVCAVVALAGLGVTTLQHRDALTLGNRAMLLGLEYLERGDVPAARSALFDAADDLRAGSHGMSGLLGQPARLIPGVAQNRSAAVGVLGTAADAAMSAAQALSVVDLDRLRVVDGMIDIAAFDPLVAPFEQLQDAVLDLNATLVEADSPWLVPPVEQRLATTRQRTDRLAPQSIALTAAARTLPDMLGADGPRRYFLAFVNGAESRAHSGLMGNWNELSVDQGQLSVTRSGRTAELQRTLNDRDVFVDQPPEFFVRLGSLGAGNPPEIGVHPNLWANITSTPDMVTVGEVMAELYEVYAGYPIDGVIVIDPAGIAALLSVTGPVEVEGLDERLTAANAERFLVLEQYEFAESDREDVLDAVTDATVDLVLSSALPAPQDLASAMSDAVLNGHISAWAARPDEQQLLALVGMEAALPPLGEGGWRGDALAVLSDNANPNKIDSFLQRDITYDVVVDEVAGDLDATLRVELTNSAPEDGFEDYVIGNAFDLAPGTNRTVLTVMSPHDLVEYRVNGRLQNPPRQSELGWNAWPLIVQLPPRGGTATIEVTFAAQLEPGAYQLLLRPQPLPNTDDIAINVTSAGGRTIVAHTAPVLRRSVLDARGIRAWR